MKSSTTTRHKGPYTIRAMQMGQGCQAQVLRVRTAIGPRHHGNDPAAAIAAAEEWLNRRATAEGEEREKTGAPSPTAYREALDVIGLNRGEKAMLQAHLAAPWHTLTATELAKAAGWENWSAANLHYGGLGRKVAELLGWEPKARRDGTPIWTMAIALPASLEGVPAEESIDFLMSSMETGGEFEWTLRPQMVAAVAQKLSSSAASRS